jgi:hypothetical protein
VKYVKLFEEFDSSHESDVNEGFKDFLKKLFGFGGDKSKEKAHEMGLSSSKDGSIAFDGKVFKQSDIVFEDPKSGKQTPHVEGDKLILAATSKETKKK